MVTNRKLFLTSAIGGIVFSLLGLTGYHPIALQLVLIFGGVIVIAGIDGIYSQMLRDNIGGTHFAELILFVLAFAIGSIENPSSQIVKEGALVAAAIVYIFKWRHSAWPIHTNKFVAVVFCVTAYFCLYVNVLYRYFSPARLFLPLIVALLGTAAHQILKDPKVTLFSPATLFAVLATSLYGGLIVHGVFSAVLLFLSLCCMFYLIYFLSIAKFTFVKK